MEGPFYTFAEDMGLVINLVREANIVLASLPKDSPDYIWNGERFDKAIRVMRSIESTEPQCDNDINFIINVINRIWNVGILSPLTLKDDEFLNYADSNGHLCNTRYHDIYVDTNLNMSICNANAFNLYVRAAYSHDENKQIECTNEIVHKNHRIYISKGGVITGEYIERCIIRPDIIAKHSFTIQSIPNIPVCIIVDKDDSIYVVDHREPKLKALQQFYDVPINKDENITNRHYNLRKYNKIK